MNHSGGGQFEAVFFDLDGTLVDTAPDMVGVLQDMQSAHGIEPIDYNIGRSNVSNGALGLLSVAFPNRNIAADDALMCEYIQRYSQRVCVDSALFAGMEELLRRLDQARRPWGIVTNKPARLTDEILDHLALRDRAVCAVSGDTLAMRKPDPAPLLHACQLADVRPEESLYVGDSRRDIEAARRAGMTSVAAAYGYITDDDDATRWGADLIAADTDELAKIVLKAVNLAP